jgi:membrane associated rhomboid family serine protease
MRESSLFLGIILSFLAHSQATIFFVPREGVVQSLRGGQTGNSPYGLNPSWVPSPTQERNEHEAWIDSQTYNTHNVKSALTRPRRYLSQLHQTSPSLFFSALSCVVVFLLWQIPSISPLLQNYFVCSRNNLHSGRFPSIILSAISHTSLIHLAVNLMALLNVGPAVERALAMSGWPLWHFLLGAASAGSMLFLLVGSGSCVGLSGVTLALVAMEARIYPTRILGIVIGIFPVRMRAENLLKTLLAWSLLGSFSRRSDIAHLVHLGGLLFGMLYYEIWNGRKHSFRFGLSNKRR